MNSFLEKPVVQNTLRFFFAYILFGLFAILGVEVVVNLHSAIYRISLMATTRIGVGNVVYVVGGFILFAFYAVAIVALESLMNNAAKTGRMLPVGVRIFAVEAGLALLAILLPKVAQLIFLPG
jgi:hypothetical protein